MEVDIIGAGIAGLTMAIALERKGIKVRIFEQAASIKAIGAGIILANNAMQVYEKLALRNQIEENGHPISSMNITKANLEPISKIDLAYFEQKHQVKNIAIHRAKLQQILIENLQHTKITLGHKLSEITKNSKTYSLKFENGHIHNALIVIGADGINSIVRQNILPKNSIRKANQICWRGITDYQLPQKYKNELNEAWGNQDRFGFVQIAENKVYWYALKSFNKDKHELSIKSLENYFGKYNSMVQDIIASTEKEQLNTAEITDLKPTHVWFKDNVCLIGDSAHATTPNMGQGACQAIEDAFILSEYLSIYKPSKAFTEYQNIRLPKAHKVVKTSWLVGKMAHLKNPILIGLRNQILRLSPDSMNRKQNEQIFQLTKIW